MTDLVTFGETMLRLSPPADRPIETADEFVVHAAGAESNVAVAAQRLGLDTVWLSKLPDTAPGRRVTGSLRRHDVDTAVVWSDDGRQGTYYLETGDEPRGTNVIYDREGAAITTATPDELPTDRIADATAFCTTGITPALSDTLAETTAALLAHAQTTATTTVFDLNYRSKLWSPTDARSVLTDLFEHIDVLSVAKRDAETVLERDGTAEDIARDLTATFEFETTIITRGEAGVLAVQDDTVYEQLAFQTGDSHPIGTGDAFIGGFLASYLQDEAVPEALEYGAATAALKRTIPGDMAIVTPADVESVIAGSTDAISR